MCSSPAAKTATGTGYPRWAYARCRASLGNMGLRVYGSSCGYCRTCIFFNFATALRPTSCSILVHLECKRFCKKQFTYLGLIFSRLLYVGNEYCLSGNSVLIICVFIQSNVSGSLQTPYFVDLID